MNTRPDETLAAAPSVPATSTATLLWSVRATPTPGQRPRASGVSSPQWRRWVGAASSAPHGSPEWENRSEASCRSLKSCRGNDATGRYLAEWFLESQFTHKIVNLLFTIPCYEIKLTIFWVN